MFKLSAEMSIITSAFVIWEPTNFYILVSHGAFSSSGLAPEFDARRHHVLNMTYLTVLALSTSRGMTSSPSDNSCQRALGSASDMPPTPRAGTPK